MKTIKKRPLRKKKILSKILRKYRRKKNIIGGTAKKIPKIVHQIWIGENKRPDIWMDTVKKFCNDYGYEYKLWDDNTVNTLNLINKQYYDMEPQIHLNKKNYQLKADILRYELLYSFGGIYIDADIVISIYLLFHILFVIYQLILKDLKVVQ